MNVTSHMMPGASTPREGAGEDKSGPADDDDMAKQRKSLASALSKCPDCLENNGYGERVA